MKTNIIFNLPRDIVVRILEFDGTYREDYSLCMVQLNDVYLLHQRILHTYICVNDNNKHLFKGFSPMFYKYLLAQLKQSHSIVYNDSQKRIISK